MSISVYTVRSLQWFASSIQLWATFKRMSKATIHFDFVEIVEKGSDN